MTDEQQAPLTMPESTTVAAAAAPTADAMDVSVTPEEKDAEAAERERQRKRDNDIIKWPDEEPPKKEVWEVEALYDWEKEERG